MKHLKIFSLIFSFAIMSCEENKPKENNLKDEIPEGIIGHTFFKVSQTKNRKVLYKPCDANIPKYKIFKDSIFHNWAQEYYSYNITSVKNMKLQTSFRTNYKYNNEIPGTKDSLVIFEKVGKDKMYWKINGEIFIDSLYVNKIPNITQPCSECSDDCGSTVLNNVNNNISQNGMVTIT
ncbi:hypothetical protein OF897_07025 [Chryseobacterium formosus]|uniref:Lipoprotein n=1 Tax=Chryseobacterium formosus TaxID=1537363 RepID=A0ABT3XNF6_9FLAO|nr:hypothetical protein [Chryseobacterium formosus]MCX8523673.1 hypothetical protein [Chryseobacterium formosus]